ncbi:uncharacterized protein VTP21DRAFT_9116 [Calcarisporiella thermophila]|uniref:uncharacterized protein n=1 Tax=Calcarisporiella thermophila TaxID=911321 RepID=UPI003742CBCE
MSKGKEKAATIDDSALEQSLTQLEQVEKEIEAVDRELVQQQVKLTAPIFQKRRGIVAKIPKFWVQVLRKHPITSSLANDEDQKALEFLTDIEVVRDAENPDNYKLVFTFDENPYFTNKTLTKEIQTEGEGEEAERKATACKVEWKKGKELVKAEGEHPGDEDEASFFDWFVGNEDVEIADMFRDDVYANAVRYFLDTPEDDEEEGDEEDEDEEEERPKKKNKKE